MSNVTESASQLSREAKSVQQVLKELQKQHDPWARDVEFQRKNLRRMYLRLLLIYPYAKESKDIETHLWMQTSYQFISQYKQRVSQLERYVHGPPPRNNPHSRHQQGGPVEYHKLLSRFRQFLGDEERFWIQLVQRFRRAFGLSEAQPALTALGIAPSDEEALPQDAIGNMGQTQGGRNNPGFPPEDPAIDVIPQKPEQRKGQLFILSKALVCLGDLARYRELYNDSGGRPRAGHEDGPGAPPAKPPRGAGRGRGGRGAPEYPARERNYEKAQKYYEQARLLVPDEGNPSHQLAILAMYKKDTFGSVVHYYKALCVQQPYDPATENLATVLNKALEAWRQTQTTEKPTLSEPRHRVAAFKNNVLVLHALWRLGVEETQTAGPSHAEQLLVDFESLLSDRILPTETIRDVVMLAQGALLKHRKFRDPPIPGHRRSRSSGQDQLRTASASSIESQIATHVVALHKTLMQVGAAEVEEKPPEDAVEGDLAQRITAVFRRTLPALRIAGKWLRANIGYVTQRSAPRESDGQDRRRGRSTSVLIAGMDDFWAMYTRFMSALLCTFPRKKLPELTAPQEEDIDLAGFIPLKRLLVDRGRIRLGGEEVHPNDEQLMRIADILADARSIAELAESPIVLRGSHFARASEEAQLNDSVINGAANPSHASPMDVSEDVEQVEADEDDVMAETMTDVTRTDDDPVREAGDAFRQGLGAATPDIEGDDEDEIVWNPRPPLSPIGALRPVVMSPARPARPLMSPNTSSRQALSPIGSARPTTIPSPALLQSPNRQTFGPIAAPQSPARVPQETPSLPTSRATPNQGTTALDLLNKIRTAAPMDLRPQDISNAQAEPLFGTGTRSIWSGGTTTTPKYVAIGPTSLTNSQYYSPRQPTSLLDSGLSQPLGQTLYTSSSQAPQNGLSSTASVVPFAVPPQVPTGHHRVASASMASSLHPTSFPSQVHARYDRFGGYNTITPSQQFSDVGSISQLNDSSALSFADQPHALGHARGASMESHFSQAGLSPYRHDFSSQLYPGSMQPRPVSNSWGNAG